MKTNLIIVEGLPGSGKSTTADMIARTLRERGSKVCCVDEGEGEHPADYADYDFPDFETEREKILEKWRSFVRSADKDTIYVFNCIFLQNPMCETMMRFGMSESESRNYICEIAEIIRPLNPVVVYIDLPDVKAAIDSVLDERGNGWLNAVIDYHTAQGYGRENGLSGYEGYISCLEERKRRELRILRSLDIEYYTVSQDISVTEFEALFLSAGWNCPDREQIGLAVANSTKLFIVRKNGEAAAMIGWLGDYGMHWFMKDFVVRSDLRGRLIGTLLYRYSENFIKSTLSENQKVCIDLRASKGKESFYKSLGFEVMTESETGCGMEKMLGR
ncbi:MAG: GNAT family N-acetyltransferase [Oscillospiraceae bacterium]